LPRQSARDFCGKPPENLALASTRYQSRLTSCDLAEKVVMALDSRVRYTAKARDFIEEVAKVSNSFQPRLVTKKKAQPRKVAAKSTKGGGWRRQNSSSTQRALSARHEDIMSAGFVQCKKYFGAVRYEDWAKLRDN